MKRSLRALLLLVGLVRVCNSSKSSRAQWAGTAMRSDRKPTLPHAGHKIIMDS
jgi:hypothetical protein